MHALSSILFEFSVRPRMQREANLSCGLLSGWKLSRMRNEYRLWAQIQWNFSLMYFRIWCSVTISVESMKCTSFGSVARTQQDRNREKVSYVGWQLGSAPVENLLVGPLQSIQACVVLSSSEDAFLPNALSGKTLDPETGTSVVFCTL